MPSKFAGIAAGLKTGLGAAAKVATSDVGKAALGSALSAQPGTSLADRLKGAATAGVGSAMAGPAAAAPAAAATPPMTAAPTYGTAPPPAYAPTQMSVSPAVVAYNAPLGMPQSVAASAQGMQYSPTEVTVKYAVTRRPQVVYQSAGRKLRKVRKTRKTRKTRKSNKNRK